MATQNPEARLVNGLVRMNERRKRQDQTDETHENQKEEPLATANPQEFEEASNEINDKLGPEESVDMWLSVCALYKRDEP